MTQPDYSGDRGRVIGLQERRLGKTVLRMCRLAYLSRCLHFGVHNWNKEASNSPSLVPVVAQSFFRRASDRLLAPDGDSASGSCR